MCLQQWQVKFFWFWQFSAKYRENFIPAYSGRSLVYFLPFHLRLMMNECSEWLFHWFFGPVVLVLHRFTEPFENQWKILSSTKCLLHRHTRYCQHFRWWWLKVQIIQKYIHLRFRTRGYDNIHCPELQRVGFATTPGTLPAPFQMERWCWAWVWTPGGGIPSCGKELAAKYPLVSSLGSQLFSSASLTHSSSSISINIFHSSHINLSKSFPWVILAMPWPFCQCFSTWVFSPAFSLKLQTPV